MQSLLSGKKETELSNHIDMLILWPSIKKSFCQVPFCTHKCNFLEKVFDNTRTI